jgi:hypothetical protein
VANGDQNTPAGGSQIWATESACYGRHNRTNKAVGEVATIAQLSREHLIELIGRDGKGGSFAAIREDMTEHGEAMGALKNSLVTLQEETRSSFAKVTGNQAVQGTRLKLLYAIASFVAGVGATAAIAYWL